MKHAECVLACVCVRERGEGEWGGGATGESVCVVVCVCMRGFKRGRRAEYDPLFFFWHEMTNIVTLDIFGLRYAGQIRWPTMQVKLTQNPLKILQDQQSTHTHQTVTENEADESLAYTR